MRSYLVIKVPMEMKHFLGRDFNFTRSLCAKSIFGQRYILSRFSDSVSDSKKALNYKKVCFSHSQGIINVCECAMYGREKVPTSVLYSIV